MTHARFPRTLVGYVLPDPLHNEDDVDRIRSTDVEEMSGPNLIAEQDGVRAAYTEAIRRTRLNKIVYIHNTDQPAGFEPASDWLLRRLVSVDRALASRRRRAG